MVKFVFAALDFIFDKKEVPYFLEANSIPAGVMEMQEVSKQRPIKSLAQYMKRYGPEQCFISSKHHPKPWIYRELKKDLPHLRFCGREDNRNNRIYLTDINGNKFKPSCIYRHGSLIGNSFEKRIPVINPRTIVHLTSNKDLTYKSISKVKVNIPEYSVITNQNKLNKILAQTNFEYVLKPLRGSKGEGVCFNKKIKIKKDMMLQKRITPKKINNKFWDVRVFLVNGKYSAGIMRLSKSPVTNLTLTAKACPLPKRLENKLKKVSESIVRAIEKKA